MLADLERQLFAPALEPVIVEGVHGQVAHHLVDVFAGGEALAAGMQLQVVVDVGAHEVRFGAEGAVRDVALRHLVGLVLEALALINEAEVALDTVAPTDVRPQTAVRADEPEFRHPPPRRHLPQ